MLSPFELFLDENSCTKFIHYAFENDILAFCVEVTSGSFFRPCLFRKRLKVYLTRKCSCVNARGIPTVANQVLHMLTYPGGYVPWGTPLLDLAGGGGVGTLAGGRYLRVPPPLSGPGWWV